MTTISMLQKKRLDKFCAKAVAEGELDLTNYKDPQFRTDLKIKALEDIEYLLFTIHSQQLRAETVPANFMLEDLINTKHAATKCTILDYCVLAGLYELSLRIAALGGKSSIHIENLGDHILDEFAGERPTIINDIIETAKQIKLGEIGIDKHSAAKQQTLWKRFTKFVFGPHKYSLLLLLGGIAAIVAAPFTGGLSGIIMTSVGIPAILASVPAYQRGSATKNATTLVNEKIRVYYEATELNSLIDEVKNTQDNLELHTSNLCDIHLARSPRLKSSTPTPADILLFTRDKNSENETTEGVALRRVVSLA